LELRRLLDQSKIIVITGITGVIIVVVVIVSDGKLNSEPLRSILALM
jgi:hypothetical protein